MLRAAHSEATRMERVTDSRSLFRVIPPGRAMRWSGNTQPRRATDRWETGLPETERAELGSAAAVPVDRRGWAPAGPGPVPVSGESVVWEPVALARVAPGWDLGRSVQGGSAGQSGSDRSVGSSGLD